MSGLTSRRKGKAGEREAAHLLEERGFEIIELGPGRKTEDIICEMNGCRFSVEVKNHALWDIAKFRRQAKLQAKERKCLWLLLCRVPGCPGTFYVEGSDRPATIWRSNLARDLQ